MAKEKHGITPQTYNDDRCRSLKFLGTDGLYRSNGTFADGEHHYKPEGVLEYLWLTHGTLVDERTGQEFTVDLAAGDKPMLLIFPPNVQFHLVSQGVSAYLCLYSPDRIEHLHTGDSIIEWGKYQAKDAAAVTQFLNRHQLVQGQFKTVCDGGRTGATGGLYTVFYCRRTTKDAPTLEPLE